MYIQNTISCVLALQKLFGKYIFSSGYNAANDVGVFPVDSSHAESMFVPLLGNHNVEVILFPVFWSRVEKTDYISRHALTKKYLDVCWKVQLANLSYHERKYLLSTEKVNCGWCDKCMRTLLTLEVLGRIDDFDGSFDLGNYYKHRDEFLNNVFSQFKNNPYYQEIIDLIFQRGFQVPRKIIMKYKIRKSMLFNGMLPLYRIGRLPVKWLRRKLK